MKILKAVATFAVSALFFQFCTSAPDPMAEAIENAVMESVEGKYSFRMDRLTIIDSTTFKTELERRSEIFETKRSADLKLFNDFQIKGLRQNMARKADDLKKDNEILNGLQAIREEMGGKIDEIAYYDCQFTATVKVAGQTQVLENNYATVTPDNRVISLSSSKKDLHKTTGTVIPGYNELLER